MWLCAALLRLSESPSVCAKRQGKRKPPTVWPRHWRWGLLRLPSAVSFSEHFAALTRLAISGPWHDVHSGFSGQLWSPYASEIRGAACGPGWKVEKYVSSRRLRRLRHIKSGIREPGIIEVRALGGQIGLVNSQGGRFLQHLPLNAL